MADKAGRKPSLGARLARALKPKASGEKLRKKSWSGAEGRKMSMSPTTSTQTGRRSMGSAMRPDTDYYTDQIDIQTGERRDDTDLLHSLAHTGSFDSLNKAFKEHIWHEDSPTGNELFSQLPENVWEIFTSDLTLSSAATLALTCKALRTRLPSNVWAILNTHSNHRQKLTFLESLDSTLPSHLLCYQCTTYHPRTHLGHEKLKPSNVLNPLFTCPLANEPTSLPLRTRLVPGHRLPFPFVQLALRYARYGPEFGIPIASLNRRWKDSESGWSHNLRYYYHDNHLLLRSISKTFAAAGLPPSGQRNLLYCANEDYTPHFGVCTHWRDGELMNLVKCALSHIPLTPASLSSQLHNGPAFKLQKAVPTLVTLCKECRPMRRCPDCPSEYLIELRFSEDTQELDPNKRFKQAISVTRWTDLGDGRMLGGEWEAINGGEGYDSFAHVGKRGISGIFESQSGVTLPGQRMLSLNPRGERLGEEGHNWY